MTASSQFINAVLLSVTGRAGFALNMKYNKQDSQVTLAWPATTNIKYFLSQTIPAYLSFARQFSEIGKGKRPAGTRTRLKRTQLKLREGSELSRRAWS